MAISTTLSFRKKMLLDVWTDLSWQEGFRKKMHVKVLVLFNVGIYGVLRTGTIHHDLRDMMYMEYHQIHSLLFVDQIL